MPNLLSKPVLQGFMKESPLYKTMGVGLTDSVLLLGHADLTSDTLYGTPYQVTNMKAALNYLNSDPTSPLVRGLLEAYNGGCKDIWICPVASMAEYEPDVTQRFVNKYREYSTGGTPWDIMDGGHPLSTFDVFVDGNVDDIDLDGGPPPDPVTFLRYNYYQNYYNRLIDVYKILVNYDSFEIIVPLEAPHYYTGDVDFTSQLIDFCGDVFSNTGSCTIGILGTRIINGITPSDVTALASDARLATYGSNGKFVMVVLGEGLITHPQLSSSYSASLSTQVAANLATGTLDRSVAGPLLPHVAALTGVDLTASQLEILSQARINTVVRTAQGKRGLSYQTRLLTDNTLAQNDSDFWSMGQMHIVANCLNYIRFVGYNFIGSLDPVGFQRAVHDYLEKLMQSNYIRDYNLDIVMSQLNTKAEVTIDIYPIFGVRNIYFSVMTGPGA